MKQRYLNTSISFAALILLVILGQFKAFAEQPICPTTYELTKQAHDILVIKITGISGPEFGKKATCKVLESLKDHIRSSGIELPFSYQSWIVGKRPIHSKQKQFPVQFKNGKQYLVFLQKQTRQASFFQNPHKAKTRYEVIPCLTPTFFDITEKGSQKLWLVKKFMQSLSFEDDSKKVVFLRKLLSHGAQHIKNDVLEALSSLSSPLAADVLIQTLKNDASIESRKTAAGSITDFKSDRVKRALISTIRFDPDESVQIAAAEALGSYQHVHTLPELGKTYKSASFQLRKALIQVFQNSLTPEALPKLIELYNLTESPILKQILLKQIGAIQLIEAPLFCLDAFQHSFNTEVKIAALKAISASDMPEMFLKLRPYAESPCQNKEEKINLVLLETLSQLGDAKDMLPILRDYLTCQNPKLRLSAVKVLSRYKRRDANVLLKSALQTESDPRVRKKIKQALLNSGR